ncbi:MAG TPA: TPM domain-containing protein [Candidatus Paceibacterota bacterium]|nr:TPM domain-containing protein [Candidatus Paceibacterota bacterium]
MKRGLIYTSLVVLAGALLSAPAFAYTSPGSPTGYVNDFAHVLSSNTIESLNAELSAFEASTSNQIAVVTVPNMGGDYIENYAVKLFAEWGIGKKDKDNGVLLLLSIEERKLRIEVGYGLEGALPDSVAQSIINQEMTPLLKAGDYDGAVAAGVADIEASTQGEYEGIGSHQPPDYEGYFILLILVPFLVFQWAASVLARSKSWWAGGIAGMLGGLTLSAIFSFTFWIGVIAVVGLSVLGFLLDFIVSNAYTKAKSTSGKIPWWAGSGTHSGSSSSGGGFGGFGGGSSGGGGASGGW